MIFFFLTCLLPLSSSRLPTLLSSLPYSFLMLSLFLFSLSPLTLIVSQHSFESFLSLQYSNTGDEKQNTLIHKR